MWTLPIAVLMKFQNDFGTTLVFLAIFAGVTLVAGINWRILVPIALVAGIIGTVGILLVTQTWGRSILGSIGFKTYQFARIDSWLNPSGSTTGDSYQLWQSMKAIGSGQLTGKGPMHIAVPVPVRESDMIFSVIGEAFGFVGAAVLILLYFMLIYQMIRVTFDTKNEFYAYISTGVIMMILFHVFENIGMNIGLLPLTGFRYHLFHKVVHSCWLICYQSGWSCRCATIIRATCSVATQKILNRGEQNGNNLFLAR